MFPVDVSFRNMEPSAAVESRVREKAAELERFFDRIEGCTVVVASPHRRGHKGKIYRVDVRVAVPGIDIFVNRQGPKDHSHEDVYVAIRDAFAAATRQLEDHARRGRGDVKTHEVEAHGRVARLFPHEGYGFIATSAAGDIYFHKASVVSGGFAKLEVGSEVRFALAEGEGEKGPQASTVKPIGKHHLHD